MAALAGASLIVAPGEVVCLFGPSGCGKTTLLRLAAGLEPLQAGEIELAGAMLARPGAAVPPEKRPVGLVFQDYVLFPHLTVEKNIAFGLAGAAQVKQRVGEQLRIFGISDLAHRYPHELSGGQQQRVALARAIVRRPKALLLDEPFASIDVALRRRLRGELRRMLKEQNAAVLLVTHDAEEALELGDRIALMRKGEVIETASPQALYEAPKTREGAQIFPGSQTVRGEIRDGVFHCVLGSVVPKGAAAGPACAVMRADSLAAEPDAGGAFRIADRRFVGPHWSARLVAAQSAFEASEGVLVDMAQAPEIGARMRVVADWSKTFIFAA